MIITHGFAVLDNDQDALLSRWCETQGRLDQDRAIELTYLPQIPLGAVVVDAGAAIGDHTIAYLRKVGPTGTVYAFEPNRLMFECLAYNCKEARLYPLGLADYPCTMMLQHDRDNAGGSCVGRKIKKPQDAYVVSLIALDTMQLNDLHFFKLDVEGMELKALLGAEKTIRRCRPVIVLEKNEQMLKCYGHSATDINEFFESIDYSVAAFMGNMEDDRCELIAKPR